VLTHLNGELSMTMRLAGAQTVAGIRTTLLRAA
jgi:isopentenyl diphosphate isomerase/L-lactate dehydrogenase-like FMN-dependent dehydrogenase